MTVAASGTGTLTYQWYSNTSNSNTGGTSLGSGNGAQTASYTPTTTTAGTTYYYAIVTGSCGTATSNTAAVVINPSTTIGTQPTGSTYCQNGTATAMTVAASGTGTLTYQWYSNTSNSNTGGTSLGSGNGAQTASYTPPTTTAGTTYYYAIVTGSCGTATSNTAAVVINPTTTIGTQPTGSSNCQNGTATPITVVASGTGTLTYQWYSNTSNSNTGGTSLGSGNGAQTASYTPPTTSAGTVYYYVTISGGCGSITSNTAAVSVDATPVAGTIAVTASSNSTNPTMLCEVTSTHPSNSATFTITGATGTVTWEQLTNGGTWTTASGTISGNSLTISNLTQTTLYRAKIVNGACTTPVYSNIIPLQWIQSLPPTNPTATPSTICLGQSSVLNADTGYPPTGITSDQGDFNNGASDNKVWTVYEPDGTIDGNALNAGGDNSKGGWWAETNGPQPIQANGITYNSSDNKFAITSGAYNTILESPVFSLIGVTSNLFTFSQAYNLEAGAVAKIEISTNGGSSYTTLPSQTFTGTATFGTISGSSNTVKSYSIDLTNYLGMSNLRIRFNYTGTSKSAWAIDNLSTPGANFPISYSWSGTILSSTSGFPVTATPQTTGTSYYTLQTTIAGCPGGQIQVPVVVNPLPTYGTVTQTPVCDGSNATFTLNNLTPSVTSTIVYNINGGTSQTTTVAADASGNGTFTAPLTYANNGQTLTITSITNKAVSSNSLACSVTPNISTTLTVYQSPTGTIAGATSVCQNASSPSITFSGTGGAAPYTFTYTINNGSPITTTSGNSISLPVSTTTPGTFVYNLTSIKDNSALGCTSSPNTSATVTINAQATVTPVADQLACPEGTISFTENATSQVAPSYTWQVSTDNGSTWNTIVATDPDYTGQTTNTLTVHNITNGNTKDGYLYQTNVIASAACPVPSSPAKLTIRNIWHGYTNTDWNTATNWSNNEIPSQSSCDSVIILNVANKPILSTGANGYVNHLKMRPGAKLTITGNTMHIAGSITDDNMAIDATAGTIDLNGDKELYIPAQQRVMQTIAGHMFNTPYNNNSGRLLNLQISSPNNATVAALSGLNDTLNITGTLSFGNVNNVTLHTGNNITLISDANNTARVADITNDSTNIGNTFDGWVEVERYVRIGLGGDLHPKSWQFLATPTKGQSTFQSWMENGTLASTGYGTQVVSPFGTGFDPVSAIYPSMKYYKPGTNYDPTAPDWQGIMNTGDPIFNQNGYMLFVRGDRSKQTVSVPPNQTRLRTKGELLTYTQTVPTGIYQFTSVGNPYASPIDFSKVARDNVDDFFTVWVSYLYGNYGYGAYETYTNVGGQYESTDGTVNNIIQSGQAFFVQTLNGPGNLTFNETAKVGNVNSNFVFRGAVPVDIQLLRSNLYYLNPDGSTFKADGAMLQFGNKYNNKVDNMDGRKFFNSGVNLSILKDKINLVVERMQLPEKEDTVFMNFTGASARNYRFVFVPLGLQSTGLQAYLEDHYLKTLTPINMSDSTIFDFAVDKSKDSYSPKRFDIVFKKTIQLPPSFVTVAAVPKDKDILVNWKVAHERNVESYDVERSFDGVQFSKVATQAATNSDSSSYEWNDAFVLPGYYYYRIKMVEKSEKVQYSKTVSVLIGNGKPLLTIYPNPITNGIINLQFINQPAGKYGIRLMNQLGQMIASKQIVRMNGSNTESIQWNYNLSHGVYQLEVLYPNGEIKVIKVIY
jgi:hypothetical protein